MRQIITTILLFTTITLFGQNAEIKFQLDDAAGDTISLGYYYLDEIYVLDSISIDENGFGQYQSVEPIQQGLYKVYLDGNRNFDFLLGEDQTFTIKNPTFDIDQLEIKGAKESNAFAEYTIFLKKIQKRSGELIKKRENASEAEKKEIDQEIDQLKPQLEEYWLAEQEKHPNTFYAKFLMANYIPTPKREDFSKEVQQNDSLWAVTKYQYQKNHYWENLDYTDDRFMYTPTLKPRLDTWFKNVLYQDYDTIQPYVINLIEKAKPNKKMYQFLTSYFINNSLGSNILGMDALFVDIAKKYYLSGEADWATEESLSKIKENVAFIEHNLIGVEAPDLTMQDINGVDKNLYSIDAPYTIVLIYEPNCSHCKKTVPALHEKVYKKYAPKGLEVYAIYSMDKKEEWTDFVNKHNLQDWINVWDPTGATNFKILYDGRTTPGIYVLDNDKKIVLKKMSVEQLDYFFDEKL